MNISLSLLILQTIHECENPYIDCLENRILFREFIKEVSIGDVIASFEEILDKEMIAGKTGGIITYLREENSMLTW